MPTRDKPEPAALNSTMATRKAEREAREAAGETAPPARRKAGFRAGVDAENPILVVTRVQA